MSDSYIGFLLFHFPSDQKALILTAGNIKDNMSDSYVHGDFLLFHFPSDQKAQILTATNTADDPKSDLNGRFLTLSLSPGFQLFPTSLTSYSDNMQQFAKDDECDFIVG